jgi:hypothetical protein
MRLIASLPTIAICAFFISGIGADAAQTTVGNAKVVVRTVTGAYEGEMRELQLLDDVYHNEKIETAEESATQLVFLDQTTITLGPKSKIVLDKFVYDPDPSKASFVMTATEGVFRFASGKLPKSVYRINTPAATIGIRGTLLDIAVLPASTPQREPAVAVEVRLESGEAFLTTKSGEMVHLDSATPSARLVVER